MPRQPSQCELPPDFNPETAPPSLNIDWDAYLPLFKDADISDAEKQELIEAQWSIVVNFVDLGFGVHPVQQTCGQDDDPLSDTCPDLISLLQAERDDQEHPAKEDTWQDQ